MLYTSLFLVFSLMLTACSSDQEPEGPFLVFKFKFDSTQVRQNNFGQPSDVPPGHAALSPKFNTMSTHYIELAPDSTTWLGDGKILYRAPETTAGGSNAIDFSQSLVAAEGEHFLKIPLKDITPGTYKWIRVSLAYQNYDIVFKVGPPAAPIDYTGTGTIASFIGFNTYITSAMVKTQPLNVNANKLQGFWAFEATVPVVGTQMFSGQAPAGATTVPNPLFLSSPVPQGSCVVTGKFASGPLVITGSETNDVVVTLSLSVNKSFEWKESGGNNIYEPLNGDTVVDMGIRGLVPTFE